jgi:exoribonuclease R
MDNFDELVEAANALGFTIDFSSNKALAKSLKMATETLKNENISNILKHLTRIAMAEAEYNTKQTTFL